MAIYYEQAKPDELYHHGILGMKWGVRRFQNADGSLTAAGEKRYNTGEKLKETAKSVAGKVSKVAKDSADKIGKAAKNAAGSEAGKRTKSAIDVLMNGDKDWMDNPIEHDDPSEEIRSRGKAALERLMYSDEQIFNKKFYGTYNF